MPRIWPLCPGAELNLSVLGEVVKINFTDSPGKRGHSWLIMPFKNCVSTWGNLVRSFMEMVQGQGCCSGPSSLDLASGSLLVSFCGTYNLASLALLILLTTELRNCFIKQLASTICWGSVLLGFMINRNFHQDLCLTTFISQLKIFTYILAPPLPLWSSSSELSERLSPGL